MCAKFRWNNEDYGIGTQVIVSTAEGPKSAIFSGNAKMESIKKDGKSWYWYGRLIIPADLSFDSFVERDMQIPNLGNEIMRAILIANDPHKPQNVVSFMGQFQLYLRIVTWATANAMGNYPQYLASQYEKVHHRWPRLSRARYK